MTSAKDKLCVNGDQVHGLWKGSISPVDEGSGLDAHLVELGAHLFYQGKKGSTENINPISLLSIYLKWISQTRLIACPTLAVNVQD
jgi:hypothetical protein